MRTGKIRELFGKHVIINILSKNNKKNKVFFKRPIQINEKKLNFHNAGKTDKLGRYYLKSNRKLYRNNQ